MLIIKKEQILSEVSPLTCPEIKEKVFLRPRTRRSLEANKKTVFAVQQKTVSSEYIQYIV